MTAFRIAIPARYASTRFPGKPLASVARRPMLEHVWHRAVQAGPTEVVVATDDDRIVDAATAFGADVCRTRADHASGTDRLAEVAAARDWPDDAIVVNLQGDEPLMPPPLLAQVAGALAARPSASLATLATALEGALDHADSVKVVTDREGFALYFSRAPIPFPRNEGAPGRRHLGIYAYRVGFLRAFTRLEPAPIERAEQLEQLRALWHGYRIHVSDAPEVPAAGIDSPGDVARVESALLDEPGGRGG